MSHIAVLFSFLRFVFVSITKSGEQKREKNNNKNENTYQQKSFELEIISQVA